MNARSSHTGSRAMTLLEVMLALALLLVLSAGVTGFFFQMTARRDQLVRLASQQRDVAALFDRLESALLASVTVSPDGSAGVSGDATSLTITTRGVLPALQEAAALADAGTLSFSFNERAETCTQSLEAVGSGGTALSEPLLRLVERLRFRYSDGKNWKSSYDSIQADGLPVAVEVSIWLAPRVPRPAPADDPAGMLGQGHQGAGFEGLPGATGDTPAGPIGIIDADAAPGAEPTPWIPREPDHLRVISIPDAPEWQERGP